MIKKWLSTLRRNIREPWEYNIIVAYILYFTGGVFALHLFYLRRYRHAFISLSTFGGGCFMGLFYDLFHLSTYVRQANKLRFHQQNSLVSITLFIKLQFFKILYLSVLVFICLKVFVRIYRCVCGIYMCLYSAKLKFKEVSVCGRHVRPAQEPSTET